MSRFWLVLLLLSTTLIFSGCRILVDSETGKWTTEIGSPKPTLTPDAVCGTTTCHGLNIECGQEVPEACTMEYQLGDFCQQYSNCAVVEGQCQSKTPRLLAECISCVELCDSGLDGADPMEAFTCEEQCRGQLEVMERSL